MILVAVAVLAAYGATSSAPRRESQREQGEFVSLFDFISAVTRLDRLNHIGFDKLTRQSTQVSESNAYFATYRYDGFLLGDKLAATHVELREPIPGSGATGGALLRVDVSGACLTRQMLEQQYGVLRLVQVPRGHASAETTVFAFYISQREVRFGFPETEPNCMSRLTVEMVPSR